MKSPSERQTEVTQGASEDIRKNKGHHQLLPTQLPASPEKLGEARAPESTSITKRDYF